MKLPPRILYLLGYTSKKGDEYREILRILSLFGYCSIKELQYCLKIGQKDIHNRLWYLVNTGLIKKFPSDTSPKHFYCLSDKGRKVIKLFEIYDFISDFVPSRYSLMWHRHHRTLILLYAKCKELFKDRFKGWISDEMLRKELWRKVFDAELIIRVPVEIYRATGSGGYLFEKDDYETEYWGIELETELKSSKRLDKLVDNLSSCLWERKRKGPAPLKGILFFYNSDTVKSRLQMRLKDRLFDCYVIFVDLNDFLNDIPEGYDRYDRRVNLLRLRSRSQYYDANGKLVKEEFIS